MKTVTGDPHEFVEAFERRYLSLTELPAVTDVRRFDPDDGGHRRRSYLQVGVRTSFPVDVVESWEPGFVAREVVDGIERTELSVVADAAADAAPEAVRPDDAEDLLTLLDARDVGYLLAPANGPVVEVIRTRDGVDGGSSDGSSARASVDGVPVYLHSGDSAVGLEEGAVDVVQKSGEDAAPPELDFFDGASFNHDRRLMVYFGDDVRTVGDRRYFDLLYRAVFSRPQVGGTAFEIEVQHG